MIYIPPKILGYGLVLLAVAAVAGTLYGCGRKDKADATSLKVAREVIKTEREALKITHQIDMRVNAEGIQTATKAQEADREIAAIRDSRREDRTTTERRTTLPSGASDYVRKAADQVREGATGRDSTGSVRCDDSCARVLQLAQEARAAARESSAKLQSARAGAR